MKPKVVFILPDKFADWEYAPIATALTSREIDIPEHELLFASAGVDPIKSLAGLTVIPDITLDEIPADAVAVIMIGAGSLNDESAAAYAPVMERFRDKGTVTGAICLAAGYLAENGVLNHHMHTVNDPKLLLAKERYTNTAGYVPRNAVHDRNLVTGNGKAPYAFAREVLITMGYPAVEAEKFYKIYRDGLHPDAEEREDHYVVI